MSLLFSFCITSFNSFLFFFLRLRPPLRSTLFPYTTLFRSKFGVRFTSGYVTGPYCSPTRAGLRSEEHTSELQSRPHLVCRLLLEKKNLYHKTGLLVFDFHLI